MAEIPHNSPSPPHNDVLLRQKCPQPLYNISFKRYVVIMKIHPSDDNRSIELTDPRALRALAHPMRLELMRLLRTHETLTATLASELTGESAGSCSFHFRQLAKWGLVEVAEGGKGRERPWKATAPVTTWSSGGTDTESQEVAQLLNGVLAERYVKDLLAWYSRRDQENPKWTAASLTGDVILRLTVDELSQLTEDIRVVLEGWNQITTYRQPTDTMRFVQFVGWAYPLPQPPLK